MKIRRIVASAISVVGLCVAMPIMCFAGGMNANESSVYSAASGTFEYEGQTYKAAPEYLAQLQAYLCRDDIDLTADQANSAISEMYSNIAQGVTDGYILPIGGDPATGTPNPSDTPSEPATGTPNTSGTPSEPATGVPNSSDTPSGQGTNGSADTPEATNPTDGAETEIEQKQSTDIGKTAGGNSVVTSNGTIFGGVTEEQQKDMEETLSTRVSQEEANAEITYNKENNSIVFQTADGMAYKLPEDINAKMFGGWIRILQVIGIVLCAITVLCGIALFVSGSMKFQKKKPANSNHKMRKGVRKITGILLTVVLAVNLFGIGGILWMQMSYFDGNKILNSLSDSGYYHEAYDAMMKDVHAIMKTSGCMENICDDVLTYENFMFATKNQIQLALQGRTSSATFEEVKKDVVEELDGIEYFTQNSKEMLGTAVLVIYQSSIKNVIGDVAYAIKNLFGTQLRVTEILMAVSAVVSILLLVCSERYSHRGVRRLANACLMSGVAMVVVNMWIGIGKPYTEFYIAPDYLYLFMVYLIKSSVKTLAIVAGIIVIISVLLYLSAYGLKKRLER